MKSSVFNKVVILLTVTALTVFGAVIIYRDPFFHYHKPLKEDYYLDGAYARYYNDGFIKYFDYDAIILGSSMCNNFKTSLVESLFGVDAAIKVNASGSYFKETNNYLKQAFECNDNIKLIIRGLDCDCLNLEEDADSIFAREAYYLRDNNILNDVNYIFNKKVMLESNKSGTPDWDEYLSWRWQQTGAEAVANDVLYSEAIPKQKEMDDETCHKIVNNIENNIVAIMHENEDTEFYLFFTPYSICAWGDLAYSGEIKIQICAQEIAIKQILQCENAHLFSFCNNFDMVCNLDNYIDKKHYAYWINDDILYYMQQGCYQITWDNFEAYLEEIEAFYMDYPYDSLRIR